MADKILPFDTILTPSGREINIKSSWEYSEVEIVVDKDTEITIKSNLPAVTQDIIVEWADNSEFDFGVENGGLLAFVKSYGSPFSGSIYLLGKENLNVITYIEFENGLTKIDYNQISNAPLTDLIIGEKSAVNGNVSNLPATIEFIDDQGISEITNYTGFVFAPGMRRLRLRPIFPFFLFSGLVDQLLIDASLTTWQPGAIIDLAGYNAPRTAASDQAVIDLQAQGVTVTVNSTNQNNDYYMYNNQFDNLNTASELQLAAGSYIDLTTTSAQPIELNGPWFFQWVNNNITGPQILFGGTSTDYEIKINGAGIVSVNAQDGVYTPVSFTYALLPNKVYTLQSDGASRFILFENGSEVDNIAAGSNIPVFFRTSFIGFSTPIGPTLNLMAYASLGVNGVKLHEYLFNESSGLNIYDSIGGFHATLEGGAEIWNLGKNTPIQAGTQIALNSWNNTGGVIIPENKNNLGFDVLGAAITRPSIEGKYNFPGLVNNGFNATNFLDRSTRGTDIYLMNYQAFLTPGMFICGDDIYSHSIDNTGVCTFNFGGGSFSVPAAQLQAGVTYMIIFMVDGGGGGEFILADYDNAPQSVGTGAVGPGAVAVQTMSYGNVLVDPAPNKNFDGYISNAVHFPRDLNAQEILQAWYYYKRFF